MVTLLWRVGAPQTAIVATTGFERFCAYLKLSRCWRITPERVCTTRLEASTIEHLGAVQCASALAEMWHAHGAG